MRLRERETKCNLMRKTESFSREKEARSELRT